MDGDWIGKFFSWQLAVWSAFLLNVAALLRLRNERKRDLATEKENEWERILEELDRVRTDRDYWHAKYIESEAANDALQRECHEHKGARVIVEAELIALNKIAGRPTILPGATGGGDG